MPRRRPASHARRRWGAGRGLLAPDDEARTVIYRIFGDNPFGVRRYVSTVRVAPLTMTGQTFRVTTVPL